ncbi:transcriptional repressor general negative regulator of transcription subunit 4 [Coemansia umbellata]|uniref:Transcriptional repressor general negative regulator of transcription subunit 4 n=1 Tax=Coemansia umbellata TaxID=1424467 RepID=A0ABQ8PJQ7_9FUNG|nr:transcriptional repressor general negative regulator of transcription subunit 4 [Coemansia umbellata]
MSSSEVEDWECPLCMEEMDIDDRGFFPCECGYQICRFCHYRISEDFGGRCPACRRLYSEQTPKWKPISPAQVAKIKTEKKAKEREKREIESNNRRHLANVRVVQKNLVYVIGLPSNLATEETLRSYDYFGQFGRINKIVVNRRQAGASAHHPTVGVYVTYATKEEATRSINAVDGSMLENRVLRATFGTTKYCSYYLRSIPCQNPNCMYLHEPGEEADSFTKEDLAANRVGARDPNQDHPDLYEHDDHSSNRASTRSPNVHLGSGRVATVPAPSLAGSHGNGKTQPPVTAAIAAAAAATAAAATASASTAMSAARLRKPSEANGSRPRSVEPNSQGIENNTGSALPATASWASRAMAKKPTASSAVDLKARKSESGGTMTLRMVPASRSKTTAPTHAKSTASATATPTNPSQNAVLSALPASSARNHSKQTASQAAPETLHLSSVLSNVSVAASSVPAEDTLSSLSPSSSAQQQHHPMLQQLTRERKQQLRHQNKLQQKQANAADAEMDADTEAEAPKRRGESFASEAGATITAKQSHKGRTSKSNAPVSASENKEPASSAADKTDEQAKLESKNSAIVGVESAVNAEESANKGSTQQAAELPSFGAPAQAAAESGDAISPGNISTLVGAAGTQDIQPSSGHANSALSFQSITDSLFAQLNAKVSTMPSGNALSGFSNTPSFDGHAAAGMRAPGYPISGVDPLLFPPSVGGGDTATSTGVAGRAGGPPDAPASFSLFSGQPLTQWGGSGAASGAYTQNSLNSLLGDASMLGAPAGGSSLSQQSLRQRSRWDFAHADEASAQAELQSVLGRGLGGSSGTIGQQQTQAVPGASATLASSRDLGMFSTPIQNNYATNSWGGIQAQQRHQMDGASAPLAPPGFGGRPRTDGGSLSPLASDTPPIGIGAIGPNTLLSRLIGQTPASSSNGVSNEQPQQLSQLVLQDPSIISSYMTMPNSASSILPQQQQQQQQGRGRADPNVLNSLLSRLHLGRGEGESTLHSGMGGTMAPPPQSLQYNMAASSSVPPGISPLDMAAGSSISPAHGMAYLDGAGVNAGAAALSAGSRVQLQHGISGPPSGIISRGSTAPGSPLGPPPGIASPPSGEIAGGQGQASMVSRSANSSGRSRFLNHFSGEGPQKAGMEASRQQQARRSSEAGDGGKAANEVGSREEDSEARMVNGVPPGLPTTGLFGELLRRAKQDGLSARATGKSDSGCRAADGGVDLGGGGTFVSGKMMLSDIERKLDAARREAQELQAQLTTVIGQNQSVMWALANGGSSNSGNGGAGGGEPEATSSTGGNNNSSNSTSASANRATGGMV